MACYSETSVHFQHTTDYYPQDKRHLKYDWELKKTLINLSDIHEYIFY
jgi:hypothetical protein